MAKKAKRSGGLTGEQRKLAKALGLPVRGRTSRVAVWTLRAGWRSVLLLLRQGRVWWRALLPVYVFTAVWLVAAVASLAERGARTVAGLAVLAAPAVWWWLGLPAGPWTRRRRVKPLVQRCW